MIAVMGRLVAKRIVGRNGRLKRERKCGDRWLMGRHWPVTQRYCNSGRPTVPYCGRRAARPASTRCSR